MKLNNWNKVCKALENMSLKDFIYHILDKEKEEIYKKYSMMEYRQILYREPKKDLQNSTIFLC